jgi:hypothetical protein
VTCAACTFADAAVHRQDTPAGVLAVQAKEIARLNSVYNKLLKDAGVEMIGEALSACNAR